MHQAVLALLNASFQSFSFIFKYLLSGRFAEFIEGSPHLTEGEVMEYSHWEYNTDDDDNSDLYTDDEEAEAASDINQDEILY